MTDEPTVPGSADPTHGGRCSATARGTGERCRRQAMRGATVCYVHGGQLPVVKAAAKRRLDAEKAQKVLDRIDLSNAEPVTDPVAELAAIAGKATHLVDVLNAQTAQLEPGEVVESPKFLALERAIDRASKVLVDINRLDLIGKRIAVDAASAQALQAIIVEAIKAAGGDPTVANRVIDARLAALERGS